METVKPNLEDETAASTPRQMRLPFLTPGGTLSIPFDSDPNYHWWKGGQSVEQTRAEVVARMEAERVDRTVG
jgi:hypothetical protein